MAQPLSPRSPASLNRPAVSIDSFTSIKKSPAYHASAMQNSECASELSRAPSSPFDPEASSEVRPTVQPSSPLGHKSTQDNNAGIFHIHEDEDVDQRDATEQISPSKIPLPPSSPFELSIMGDKENRSPTRSVRQESSRKGSSPIANESVMEPSMNESHANYDQDYDTRSMVSDDTCFSTFSAVPNADMTMFAALGGRGIEPNTPFGRREGITSAQTPSAPVFMTPATSRRGISPLGRRQPQDSKDNDTTNLLLDFTERTIQVPPRGATSPSKSRTEPNLLVYMNSQRNPSPTKTVPQTPNGKRTLLNLLDFDLPPQPTPRSIPTITIRELESLKSTYLSEISSLKACLSGRQAEVDSLKKAVGDAERRVGEALEKVREERNAREHAEKEKEEWEKKGKEVEILLNEVREEVLAAEKEREEMVQKLEENNRLREEAEIRAIEAATRPNVTHNEAGEEATQDSMVEALVANRVSQQLDEKMENLARELHTVYKKKHEAKVSTLKKTYEARSEKKSHELHRKIEELSRANEELQASKDSTLSGAWPVAQNSIDIQRLDEQNAQIQEQTARIAGLLEEMKSVREAHSALSLELETERVEKGELVAAVDEMLALQSESAQSQIEDFKKSINHQSALARPAAGESRIARSSGLPQIPTRSASGLGKSKMMDNIARMNRGA